MDFLRKFFTRDDDWLASENMAEMMKNRQIVMSYIEPLATPLNIGLLVVFVLILIYRVLPPLNFGTSNNVTLPKGPPPVVFRTFTPRTLLIYNGVRDPSVYLAVKGKVYDVTSGKNFYGPGGMYENFAGRDATRGLACQSFDEEMLTKNLDGPLDPCTDLDKDQLENLNSWVERFDEKYLVVGKLIAFDNVKNPWR